MRLSVRTTCGIAAWTTAWLAWVSGGVSAEPKDPRLAAKQGELARLLARIEAPLVAQAEADIRAQLDAQMQWRVGPVLVLGEYKYTLPYPESGADAKGRKGISWFNYGGGCLNAAYPYFDGYDLLGEKKYLQVALDMADFLLKAQTPQGFWIYRYAVFPSGEIEPLHGAGVCRIQDKFQFSPFQYLIYAHNVTGEKKYFDAAIRNADYLLSIQNENGSWPDTWTDATNRSEHPGGVSGSSGVSVGGSYNDGATNVSLQALLAAHHLTKDPKYLRRVRHLGQWIFDTQMGTGTVRGWCQQYGPDNKPIAARDFEGPNIEMRTFTRFVCPLLTWMYVMTGEERYMKLMEETVQWMDSVRVGQDPGGWAYMYLADGTPVFSILNGTYRLDQPETWPKPTSSRSQRRMAEWTKPDCYKGTIQPAKDVLKIYDLGGLAGLRAYLTGPLELQPEQYLDRRIEAARSATDEENLKLVRAKQNQWDFLRNVRIAEGKFSPRDLAPGGLRWSWWGDSWTNRVHAPKIANWLDVPLPPK